MRKLRTAISCFIFAILFLSVDFILAQTSSNYVISHRSLSVEDGLASREVLCGLQDAGGFIWLATRNGLNRYDGKNFKLFTESNGMQERKVMDGDNNVVYSQRVIKQ